MKFYPTRPLRLIEVRKGTSKAGNPFAIVKLADEETYENISFMLQKDQEPDFLQLHTRYNVEVDKTDDYVSVALTPEKASK